MYKCLLKTACGCVRVMSCAEPDDEIRIPFTDEGRTIESVEALMVLPSKQHRAFRRITPPSQVSADKALRYVEDLKGPPLVRDRNTKTGVSFNVGNMATVPDMYTELMTACGCISGRTYFSPILQPFGMWDANNMNPFEVAGGIVKAKMVLDRWAFREIRHGFPVRAFSFSTAYSLTLRDVPAVVFRYEEDFDDATVG